MFFPAAVSCIQILLFFLSADLEADLPQQIHISNTFLKLSVDTQEGRFILKSISPRQTFLTYQGKVPSTSFATIRINGADYIFGSSQGRFTVKPEKTAGNTVRAEWRLGNVFVEQFLILTSSPYYTEREDTLKVIMKVRCGKNDQPRVGLRYTLDTYLGENDGVPFYMPGVGRISGTRHLNRSELPPYGYTLDTTKESNIRFQITFPEDEKGRPDEVVMASWEHFRENPWKIPEARKDTFRKDLLSINDSAVSLYWQPVLLAQDAPRSCEFYYGLYNGEEFSTNNLKILITMPEKSRAVPFFINLNLKNNSELVFQDVRIRAEPSAVSDFIFLTDQEAAIPRIGPFATRDLSFKVEPLPSASGYYDFFIRIRSLLNGALITNTIRKGVRIVNFQPVELVSDKFFSPDRDGACDTLAVTLRKDTAGKTLFVKNAQDETVRSLLLGSNVSSFVWDGTDDSGRTVAEGPYYLSVFDPDYPGESSNRPLHEVVVDVTPPALNPGITNKVVNMKRGNAFQIRPMILDTAGISRLELSIFNTNLGFFYNAFFNEPGTDPLFTWDFRDDSGQAASGEENYYIRLAARDNACNFSVATQMIFLIAKTNENRIFPDINFKFNSASVEERYYGLLDDLAAMLKNGTIGRLTLVGHTDSVGSELYNKDLSVRRARAVREYISRKLDDRQKEVIFVGKGFRAPKADNVSAEGRQINRRVEIIVERP